MEGAKGGGLIHVSQVTCAAGAVSLPVERRPELDAACRDLDQRRSRHGEQRCVAPQ